MSFELLKKLTEAHGVSGREDEVRAVVREELAALGLDCEEDVLGNLIVEAGGDPAGPAVLLDAHMDEIGLMISHLHPEGGASFATLGGWDPRNLPAQRVTVRGRLGHVAGVVGSKPPHIVPADERSKAWKPEALWIDFGTRSEAETRALGIEVGDPAVLDGACERLRPGLVRAKALDDRAGCYAILRVLRALREKAGEGTKNLAAGLPCRLFASFTTSEEVGLRGARALGGRRDWDVAIHLEATVAADVPGAPASQRPSVMGAGPAITVADNSAIVPERMVRFLEETARTRGIPSQRKKPTFGGTNAGAMHMSGRGVLCGVVAVPCRFIHSPVTLMLESDLEATVALALGAVESIGDLLGA